MNRHHGPSPYGPSPYPLPKGARARDAERLDDALEDAVDVREYLVVPKAEDGVSLRLEELRPGQIVMQPKRVLATIELDDQASLSAAEVSDEGADGVLAAEPPAVESAIAKP